jgi:hypothetical protein
MREIVVIFDGDDWDDEAEAEALEELVCGALDAAGVDYKDVTIR